MTEAQIKHMVDRFLGWKLPESFNPDGGISFKKTHSEQGPLGPQKYEPIGTNVFDAEQATAMVLHMIEGMPGDEALKSQRDESPDWPPRDCDAHYILTHSCPPMWEARIFETKWENDWVEVRARDAEQAATKFAEQYDQGGDYDIIQRGGDEIEVRKSGDDKIVMVDVSAESVPHYYGRVRENRAVG